MQSAIGDAYCCVQHRGAGLIFGRAGQVTYDGCAGIITCKLRPEKSHSLIHELVASPQVDSDLFAATETSFACGHMGLEFIAGMSTRF